MSDNDVTMASIKEEDPSKTIQSLMDELTPYSRADFFTEDTDWAKEEEYLRQDVKSAEEDLRDHQRQRKKIAAIKAAMKPKAEKQKVHSKLETRDTNKISIKSKKIKVNKNPNNKTKDLTVAL